MTNDVPEFSFPEVTPVNSPAPDALLTQPPAPAKASGKTGLVIALVLALVAVVALGAFSAYLWTVHSQYVAQNEALRETATTLGGEVATSRAKADEVQSQLDDVNAQLTDAKDTISGLANSEAQAGDDRQTLIDVAARSAAVRRRSPEPHQPPRRGLQVDPREPARERGRHHHVLQQGD